MTNVTKMMLKPSCIKFKTSKTFTDHKNVQTVTEYANYAR